MCSDPFLRKVALLSLGLVLFPGCSVKEDRSACPCLLTVTLPAPALLEVRGTDYSFRASFASDTVLVLEVPRSGVSVLAVAGALPEADGAVRIPVGEDCPPVRFFRETVPTSAETASVDVRLHKAFCTLEMTFSGPPGAGGPLSVEVVGEVDGYGADGTPSAGPFSFAFSPEPAGRGTLRLPRQRDASLLMRIVFADRIVRTFALGGYIERAGYDWTAPDLEDLPLVVNVSVTEIAFSLGPWTHTEHREVLI